MYALLVRRRVAGVFAALSRGDWDAALANTADDVHHVFPGIHPLGGERRDRALLAQWFDRLGRLFPGHVFEVHDIAVAGGPWRTRAAVRWTATLQPAVGEAYRNDGAHWIEIRWGRVTAIHAFLDTQAVARACDIMADAEIDEATAPPIV